MGRLAKLLIASTEDPDMRYAAGLEIPDRFVLLDAGKRTLFVSRLEHSRVERILSARKGCEAVLLEQDPLKEVVAHLRKQGISTVLMPRQSPAAHVDAIRKKGIRVRLAECYPERVRKHAAEIQGIRQAARAASAAMRRCRAIIRESTAKDGRLVWKGRALTSERLKAEARTTLLALGCDAPRMIISSGRQTAEPHHEGSGPLRSNMPIIIDIFPRGRAGYYADMTRTVVKGRPPQGYARLWRLVREAQQAALAAVRPGVEARSVHAAAAAVFRAAGEEPAFIHSAGHGVGLEIHESPGLHPRNRTRLKAGMVLAVEPGLYRNGVGARMEDTVLVTADGYEALTRGARVMRA